MFLANPQPDPTFIFVPMGLCALELPTSRLELYELQFEYPPAITLEEGSKQADARIRAPTSVVSTIGVRIRRAARSAKGWPIDVYVYIGRTELGFRWGSG